MPGVKTSKKYQNRLSPPYSAADYCGQQKKGNDGNMWTSVMDKNGVCRWSRREQTQAEAWGRGMWIPGPKESDEWRWLAVDKPLPSYMKNMKAKRRSKSKSKSKSKPKTVARKASPAKAKAARGRSASPCPRNKTIVKRKAYVRSDGVRVKATSYCRKR
jgi:hypothetical protein